MCGRSVESIKVYLENDGLRNYTYIDISRELKDFVYRNGGITVGEGPSCHRSQILYILSSGLFSNRKGIGRFLKQMTWSNSGWQNTTISI